MNKEKVRVRFAPSPTGFMHLGNVRAALINYLYAKQKNGTFVLRIEDTDATRNVDPRGVHILKDLEWLNLSYQEGPLKEGEYGPYYQSERNAIYKEYLDQLIAKKAVYRCYCTVEELEKKRQRQIALKMPPRYDRACMACTDSDIAQNDQKNTSFIWRFKIDQSQTITFYDLARKTCTFDMKNFSDFPLTRQDGSFTFLFANFVDDVSMHMNYIFRGEDHLTNTANQVALYQAFGAKIPTFWHLPIMGNKEGKKLSKRDFGFSLNDLRDGGYLPEAICNYLAIIGTGTFDKEIMSLEELAHAMNFDAIASTGQIKYDLEKLRWVNHQWIMKYNTLALAGLCLPLLQKRYAKAKDLTLEQLVPALSFVQSELVTLNDINEALEFYFEEPAFSADLLVQHGYQEYKSLLNEIIAEITPILDDPDKAAHTLTHFCKTHHLPLKDIFTILRVALTGNTKGPSVKELFHILGPKTSSKRLEVLL